MTGGKTRQGGVELTPTGADFTVWSRHAERVELCLFDGDTEKRVPMERGGDLHRAHVAGVREGACYGYRAHGRHAPHEGLWFDPSKLLVDPYARALDRPFAYDPRLAVFGEDTAGLVPRAILTRDRPVRVEPPRFRPGGFIYEVPVRAFTMRHPQVPEHLRGTIAALAHPAVIAHLHRLGVDAVELMPIVAWIDERHLPALGLANAWGYNPVVPMALEPRLAPGGVAELRDTVAALHEAGIGVILDLVFNHTGESDRLGPTLSLRGLDSLSHFRHRAGDPGTLVNDTGTGNTLACDQPYIRRLILDSLRHFVTHAGVDGFRFDLATILGRTGDGFQRDGGTLEAIASDTVLADRVLIAEPWDIGPGGYRLGQFPHAFLEWNDRARDAMRRFWRGDHPMAGSFATALSGSSDMFSQHGGTETRSVNFIAAHDGFTLADLVSYARKHNGANGEDNRDGHDDNHSWNNGEEGHSLDGGVIARRRRDIAALLSTLFVTRGTIMLTAGDEGGRSQQGNNNAYAQDNPVTWLDWLGMDAGLLETTARLSALRKRFSVFSGSRFFAAGGGEVEWLTLEGKPMSVGDWDDGESPGFAMVLETGDRDSRSQARLAILFNRTGEERPAALPPPRSGQWRALSTGRPVDTLLLPPRSVEFFIEG